MADIQDLAAAVKAATARRSHGPSPWFESTRPDHREQAEQLVLALKHHAEPPSRLRPAGSRSASRSTRAGVVA